MKSPYRILVIGPSWVGDMMMAQTLFMLLKQQQSDSIIDVLAPAWSLPLLNHMPEVHEAIPSPFKHGQLGLKSRYKLGKLLRKKGYDQAIVLPNSFKSALVAIWAGIPLRTGFIGELRYGLLNDARKLNEKTLPQTVMRFASLAFTATKSGTSSAAPNPILASSLPIPKLRINKAEVQTTLQNLSISVDDKLILVLCPGAEYGPAKQWPAAHLASLAKQRIESGWRVWLLGSAKDKEICDSVNSQCDQTCNNLAGKTSLGQVIDLMSCANAIVSNDSGLMHIAAALEKPLVAIYGSSDPGFTPPLTDKADIQSLGLSCSPCFKRQCPLGHLDCLNKLKPERVSLAIDTLMEQQND